MTTAFEIPLSPMPQRMSITLSDRIYQLSVTWNQSSQAWVLDLFDEEGSDLILGIPLVTGANLLEQFEYLDLGGQLIVQSDADLTAVPTFSNLGINGHLAWVVP